MLGDGRRCVFAFPATAHAHLISRCCLLPLPASTCEQLAPAQPPKLEEPAIGTKPEDADEEVRATSCCAG
jgi:hypothetical protein